MKIRFGEHVIDSDRIEVTHRGTQIALEPLAFGMLELLVRHRDRVVSKDELLDELWTGKVVSDATISGTLKALRHALGDSGGEQKIIRTVRGHGYRFVAAIEDDVLAGQRVVVQSIRDVSIANPALPAKPSVAVLGFDSVGGDPNDLFAEGLAVDLDAQLARLHGLFVIARESARLFSTRTTALREIGERLGVRYLVFGSTQRAGKRIRATINLTNAETQQTVWTDHFDRTLEDIFSVQDEIVEAVTTSLLPEIERAEMERARLIPTENLDAWECYHRAMWHNFRFTAGDSAQARALLTRAGELDPHFARAHSGLSFNHFLQAFLHTDTSVNKHIELAVSCAEKSVDLDAQDAMSHWVLGRALFLRKDHERALRSLDTALTANPNYAQGRYAKGFVEVHASREKQALSDLDVAQRLSPFDPLLFAMKSCRAISMAIQGDAQTASNWAVEATESANAHFHIHAVAAACCAMAGKDAEARQLAQRVEALHPGYTVATYEQSFPHTDASHRILFQDGLIAAGIALE